MRLFYLDVKIQFEFISDSYLCIFKIYFLEINMPKEKYFKGKKLNKNALIAEREKRKLYFKYKKSLKKEKKGLNKSETEKATNNVSHEKTAKKDKIQNQQENKPIMSSYKKVQIQYETKAKEQEEKFQVRLKCVA